VSKSPADKLLQDLARLDFLTYQHSIAVAESMKTLGGKLGFNEDQCQEAELLGAVHELGKLQTPPEIFKLLQSGKSLTPEQRTKLHHPPKVLMALLGSNWLNPSILKAIETMECRFNGTGTPTLKGEAIPQLSRMLLICDIYDFLLRQRGKAMRDEAVARRALVLNKGKWFDPVLVDVFLDA
jgi:HD-GYP domain-containing protein (c-di-GMP phosphodiesterase class II)